MQITPLYTINQYHNQFRNSNIQNKNNKWFVSRPSLNFKANPELTKQLTDTFHKTIDSEKLTDEDAKKVLAAIPFAIPAMMKQFNTASHSSILSSAINNDNPALIQLAHALGEFNPNEQFTDAKTPLMIALKWGHDKIANFVCELEDFDPNIHDYVGATALMYANNYGNLDVAKKLLKNKKTDPNIRAHAGRTALHEAAFYGQLDAVKELLKHPKIDPNIKDNDGNTALIRAAMTGKSDVAKELLKHEKIDPYIKNRDGDSAQDCCGSFRSLIKEWEIKKYLDDAYKKLNIQEADLYNTSTYLKVLNSDITNSGLTILFNEKQNNGQDSLLCKLASYPMIDENNENEFKEILNKLDKLDINYNQKDNDEISVFEHIMNSENKIFLDFVIKKGVKFDYYPNLDNRYKQIEDKDFKTLLDAHKYELVDFKDVRDAKKSGSKKAKMAVKPQTESPFFDITQYI